MDKIEKDRSTPYPDQSYSLPCSPDVSAFALNYSDWILTVYPSQVGVGSETHNYLLKYERRIMPNSVPTIPSFCCLVIGSLKIKKASKANNAEYVPAIGATTEDNPLLIAKLKLNEPIVRSIPLNKVAGNPLRMLNFGIFILFSPNSKKIGTLTTLAMNVGQKNPAFCTGIFMNVKYIAQHTMATRAKAVPLLIIDFLFFKSAMLIDERKSPTKMIIIESNCAVDNFSPRKSRERMTTIEVNAPVIVPTREEFPILSPSL
jgi:hypothetical protein